MKNLETPTGGKSSATGVFAGMSDKMEGWKHTIPLNLEARCGINRNTSTYHGSDKGPTYDRVG